MPRVDHDEVGVVGNAVFVTGDLAAVMAVVIRPLVMCEPRMHVIGRSDSRRRRDLLQDFCDVIRTRIVRVQPPQRERSVWIPKRDPGGTEAEEQAGGEGAGPDELTGERVGVPRGGGEERRRAEEFLYIKYGTEIRKNSSEKNEKW